MSIAEKFKFYHETVKPSSEEALRLATEGSIREHDLEMKRLAKEKWDKENLSEEERRSIREHELEMKRLDHDLETKRLAKEESEEERRSIRERLDQGRVCVPTIVVSFVKIAML